MKKVTKRILSLLLATVMICTVIPFAGLQLGASATSFSPRTTAPDSSNSYYYSSNIFYKIGYGMPNCTCYAFGRAYEILGYEPSLCHNNAGAWYSYNINNGYYSYGSTPKLGAIACWDKYDNNNGHVAVVEQVNSNGTILISESHYGGTYFDTRTINNDSSNYLTSYRFLGYIYIGNFSYGTTVDTATSIPDDAVVYNGHSYKICFNSLKYKEAEEYCESMGGHLVTITSQDENDFIVSLISNYSDADYTIGISDLDKEGTWNTWITGEPVTYTNWGTNEPDNNYGGQDIGVICGGIRKGSSYFVALGQWDDIQDYGRAFICEWDSEKKSNDITINYKSSITLTPTIKPATGVKYTITWESSNTNIATVDDNGTVTAVKRGSGTAIITCTIVDQYSRIYTETFNVKVSISFVQWIIIYILFGWLWY